MQQYSNTQMEMVKPFQQNGYINERAIDVGYGLSNIGHVDCGDWVISMPMENGINFCLSETSSDGELTPSRPFLNLS
jgi:hypothetical protein